MSHMDDVRQVRQFRTDQRVMESRTGRDRIGVVQPRLIGYPHDLVAVEFDDDPLQIVGVSPSDLIAM